MSELNDIVLKEVEGHSPASLLRHIAEKLCEHLPDSVDHGSSWLRGKGEQEIARAVEIRARALAKIGQLEIERQRLLQEREAAERLALQSDRQIQLAHDAKMYELQTQRFVAVIAAIERLSACGVKIDAVRMLKDFGELNAVAEATE